jgi:hypothetical protein
MTLLASTEKEEDGGDAARVDAEEGDARPTAELTAEVRDDDRLRTVRQLEEHRRPRRVLDDRSALDDEQVVCRHRVHRHRRAVRREGEPVRDVAEVLETSAVGDVAEHVDAGVHALEVADEGRRLHVVDADRNHCRRHDGVVDLDDLRTDGLRPDLFEVVPVGEDVLVSQRRSAGAVDEELRARSSRQARHHHLCQEQRLFGRLIRLLNRIHGFS